MVCCFCLFLFWFLCVLVCVLVLLFLIEGTMCMFFCSDKKLLVCQNKKTQFLVQGFFRRPGPRRVFLFFVFFQCFFSVCSFSF